MANDFEIECYQDERHIWYSRWLANPMLVAYVLGIPVVCFILLWRHRHVLDDPSIRVKYMMLAAGYKPKKYFWECVVMLRKTIMVGITVFLRRYGVTVQVYSGILLLAVSLSLQLFF